MSYNEEVKDSIREIYINQSYVSSVGTVVNTKGGYTTYKRNNLYKTDEFFKRLMSAVSIKGSVIPRNCRYIDTTDNGYKIVVIEDPPAVRTVNVDLDFNSSYENFKITGKDKVVKVDDLIGKTKPYQITLSFPYVVYLLLFNNANRFSRMKVFYRLSPITSEYDYLLLANLPNIGSQQVVCLGDIKDAYNGISDGADSAISAFWANSFNTDYISNYCEYGKQVPELKDFVLWAYNTIIDPMFIFNVKYLKNERNIKEECDFFFKGFADSNFDTSRVVSFFRSFVSPSSVSVNGKLFSSRTGTLDTCFLRNKPLSIGDKIKISGEELYINDILTDKATGHVTHLSLETPDEQIKTIPIDKIPNDQFEIYEPLIDKIKLADGSEVSVGDNVIMSYPFKKVRTIEKIRMGRDGNPEVMFKGDPVDYYLLDKMAVTKMGEIKPKFSGIELNKDDEYIIYRNNDDIIKYFAHVTYIGHDVSMDGDIILNFSENKKYLSSSNSARKWRLYNQLDDGSQDYSIAKKEDLKQLSARTFRVLNKLYQNNNKDIYMINDCIICEERKYTGGTTPTYNSELAVQDLLAVDGKKLSIPSYDTTIEFSIGDDVVIADWTSIYNMVTPRKVHSFVYDDQCLFILTIDPETGVLRKDKYIDFKQNMVYVGSIRKIDLNVKNLENGNIIVAKNPRIPYFLKKDVNKIIGLITDTVSHPPMVLCSNGLTIWGDEMDQFEIYPKRHRMYKRLLNKLSPAVDVNEIKEQLGDLYITKDEKNKIETIYFSKTTAADFGHRSYSYFINIAYPMEKNSYTARNTLNIHNKPEAFAKYGLKRYGFCRPRYSERRKATEATTYAYPNLLGGYIKSMKNFVLYEK